MRHCFLLLLLVVTAVNASNEAVFTAEPDWIIRTGVADSDEIPVAQVKSGTHYLHFGRQVRVPSNGSPAYYYRYVTKIVNPSGLDDQSQINVEFDPIYERILFHKLNIRRGGETIDRLTSTRISYLDQEGELDLQLYNGVKTMNLLLEDLRVGDVLDYSYTVEGQNPVFENYFSNRFIMQWGVPVSSVYLRILWQKQRPLASKVLNADWEITQRATPEGVEHVLSVKDINPQNLEDDTPSWVDPYASVLFSEHSSWREVAQWGRGLFAKAVDVDDRVVAVADEINTNSPDRADKIVQTLQFVQDEIRYVGIELGENSHQAATAQSTLRRRYGDCKDKSALMISLLQAMGIEAYPALVNTEVMGHLARRLPSMKAFNHVIVAVPHNGRMFWLDPTRQNQVGSLEQVFQPDYELALLLNDDSESLVTMNTTTVASGFDVVEQFLVDAEDMDSIVLTVDTEYFGYSAESQIGRLQRNGMEQLKESYLDFYRDYYPSIEQLEVSGVGVDPDSHRFRLKEEYRINNFREIEDETQRPVGWIYSNVVNPYLLEPDEISRSQDYQLKYPLSVKQSIKISLPDKDWDFEDLKFDETNDFFGFHREQRYDAASRTMHLVFSYESRKGHVQAADYSNYLAALSRAREQRDFGFYLEPDAQEFTDYTAVWIASIALYIGAILLSLLLWYRVETRNLYSGDMKYYPVSDAKFLFMWIATWGLFPIYWFYKVWQYEKTAGQEQKIMPTMRGLFFQFWYYPLFKRLSVYLMEKHPGGNILGNAVAALLGILFFIVLVFSGILEDFSLPLVALSAVLVLPLLKMINLINQENPDAIAHNSSWSIRHYLLLAIFLPTFVFYAGPLIGLLPASSVVPGNRLLGHDIHFMQREGIIQPGDKIEYFYSDAFLLIHNDGNGITQRHVFSYWIDTNNNLNVETVEYGNITDIDVSWSDGFTENTVVEVHRRNQDKMILFLSAMDDKDRLFVAKLKARWEQ